MREESLRAALQQYFGFDTFRPGQLDALRHIMEGRDVLVVMPTGAGKSLCFQLPALLREGVTLVISPLIALMKDQVDALQRNGIAATFINSTLDGGEQSRRLQGLAAGQWRLCYIAPERLRNQAFREALSRTSVDLLAVDEAHCISQWGHDFRPEYRAIGDFVGEIGRPPIAALTATATPQVQEDIERQLALNHPYRQVTGFNRANLRFDARFTPGDTLKQQMLKEFLDAQPPEASGVIYVGRRKDADEVARFVGALCSRQAVFYHGGLLGWERDRVQNEWMEGRAPIVVATNAFGMGVDKPGVRFVVHYTLPGTVEAYYQEAGRAGRDGDPAHCLLLHDPADARLHEWFIENDAPGLEELRLLYRHLMDESRRNGGTITGTSGQFAAVLDWKADGKVRVGLGLLEQAGLLENLGERGGSGCWRLRRVRGRVDMQGLLREVETRRTLRRRLLATMMEYAQTHECRRQYLLDYFGDPTPPLAEWCCDNCRREEQRPLFRAAASPAEKAPLWVLDAVGNLRYGVGRALLAKILAGGRGATMSRYFEHPQYGILRHLPQKEIQHLIDELIRERYLLIESGQYPTLALSPSGKQAVEGRLALPVGAGLGQPTAVRHVSPERLSNTAAESHRLFKQGKTVAEVASERGLTVNTIFNHLASLIEQGALPVEEVVPEERRVAIVDAVEEVGSFFLSPIKARLPEEIEYGEIRCVVAAIRRDQQVESAPPPPEQHELYTRLMQWRREVAHRINQPPYFIFSNAVLHAISMAMPRTLDALEAVRGVGPHKRDEYGETILQLVDEVAGAQP